MNNPVIVEVQQKSVKNAVGGGGDQASFPVSNNAPTDYGEDVKE